MAGFEINSINKEKRIIKFQNILPLFSLTFGLILLAGCGNSSPAAEPTATYTPEAATATPTPIPPTPAPTPVSEAVFNTPEEAITHYFEGIAQADPGHILEACAIDEMGEQFQFDGYVERVGYVLTPQSPAPADYPLYAEINKMQLSAQMLNRVKLLAYSLLSGEVMADGAPITLDPDRTTRFMTEVDPARLAGLELKGIGLPDQAIMNSPTYQENAARLAGIYQADELTERVALFSFEQNDYILGFTLLRYGESWKISDQVSPLANTNSLGVPQETTTEAFEDMINGE